jgi:hypothetical protein
MKSLQEWMITESDELQDAKDAYERLYGQMSKQLKEVEIGVKTKIIMAIEPTCEEMSETLQMALQGQKSIEDVKNFWNRLAELLSRSIGMSDWSV